MTDEEYIRDLLAGTAIVCLLTTGVVYAVIFIYNFVSYVTSEWSELLRVFAGFWRLLMA